jgi:amino acid transporter
VFLVGNLNYLITGETAVESQQGLWMFVVCLVGLWLVVGLCVLGFGISRWLSNAGGIGMLLALCVLVSLCGWSALTHGIVWPAASSTPVFHWTNVAPFGVFCLALVGPELGSVVGDEIRESTTVVPWSVWRVALLAVVCYVLGAGVLQISLPAETIHSVEGVLAAARSIAHRVGGSWVIAPLGWLMCVSVIGAAVAWFAGASRMLWVAAHDGSLPPHFARLSPRFGTPILALLVQGVLSTLILAAAFLGSHGHQVFITLVDLTVVLQLIPFLTMFAALLRAGIVEHGPRAPLFVVAGSAGVCSSLAGISLAFVPSRHVESVWTHEINLSVGCLLFLAGCGLIFAVRHTWKRDSRQH